MIPSVASVRKPVTEAELALVQQWVQKQAPKDFGKAIVIPKPSVWINEHCYIPETQRNDALFPHQESVVDYALDENHEFSTILYSTIKKSAKTFVGGSMGRYLAENSGYRAEVYFVANDQEQARGRGYQAALTGIELTPGFDRSRNLLPGQWKIIQREAVHLPTQSVMRAISSDYAGEAGSNPVASVWTELWAYKSEASRRLWVELTPVPTRKRSMRIVETYAGFEDESDLLLDLFKLGQAGRQLTHDDINWPFPDRPPIWVNESAGLFMYWDSGVQARRMPWQQGKKGDIYYSTQSQTLRQHEYERLHENKWISSVSEFIDVSQWNKCKAVIPTLDSRTPCVLGVDGSVSGDCTAISLVSRHWDKSRSEDVAVRRTKVWYPRESGGKIDLQAVEDEIREWCKLYNIVQVAYDQFQLHQMMGRLVNDAVAWCFSFGQMAPRAIADKQLYDLIMNLRIVHDGEAELAKHVQNAAAKETALEAEKMRIIKKRPDAPVDLLVATSMACHECLRLNL